MDSGTVAIHATVSAGETAALLKRLEALKLQVPVYVASPEVLRHLTGFQLTRGALCAMKRKPLPSVQELLTGQKVPDTLSVEFLCDAKTSDSSATPSESVPGSKDAASSDSRTIHPASTSSPEIIKGIPYQEKISRIAILENVVNPTNVGAIFRSAAAMGMDAILLTDDCSNPLYRRAARVSMGTVFQIPWTFIPDWPHPAMEKLRELGFQTASMALSHNTVSIDDPALRRAEKLAVILGTEGDGLSPATIAASDYTIRIPMAPGIDSLNVAAASAVAFWELGNLKRQK
ncbi:MAG: TrmH family RNA methyltransferase [Chordicoccus sp.]